MNENLENIHESKLSQSLSNALQNLPEFQSSVSFDEISITKKTRIWNKPMALAASILLSSFLVISLYNSVPFEQNLHESDLSVLIKESQELELNLLRLRNEYQRVKDDHNVLRIFNEISEIDSILAQNYALSEVLSKEQLARYWKQRIEKLNLAIGMVNSKINPVFI